jgi:hypothetical protein
MRGRYGACGDASPWDQWARHVERERRGGVVAWGVSVDRDGHDAVVVDIAVNTRQAARTCVQYSG